MDFKEMQAEFVCPKAAVVIAKVKKVIVSVLQACPEIQSITLCGATPSFNDGDLCVHLGSVRVNGHDLDNCIASEDGDEVPDCDCSSRSQPPLSRQIVARRVPVSADLKELLQEMEGYVHRNCGTDYEWVFRRAKAGVNFSKAQYILDY